jgi:hypothetical protein
MTGCDEARPSASTACWAASSGSALQVANGNQVAVSDRAHIGVVQANERLSLTGRENKLDFKTIRFVNVDDGAKIAAAQAMLGQVPIQDDGVEQVEHGYPGCAVTK